MLDCSSPTGSRKGGQGHAYSVCYGRHCNRWVRLLKRSGENRELCTFCTALLDEATVPYDRHCIVFVCIVFVVEEAGEAAVGSAYSHSVGSLTPHFRSSISTMPLCRLAVILLRGGRPPPHPFTTRRKTDLLGVCTCGVRRWLANGSPLSMITSTTMTPPFMLLVSLGNTKPRLFLIYSLIH